MCLELTYTAAAYDCADLLGFSFLTRCTSCARAAAADLSPKNYFVGRLTYGPHGLSTCRCRRPVRENARGARQRRVGTECVSLSRPRQRPALRRPTVHGPARQEPDAARCGVVAATADAALAPQWVLRDEASRAAPARLDVLLRELRKDDRINE